MERWILVLLIGLTLNLIVRTHQDVVGREPGSGGDDDDEASGFDGTDKGVTRSNEDSHEGSADDGDEEDTAVTPCEKQAARARKTLFAVGLECTQDGEFKPKQCNDRSGECWCVDKEGKEKPGSRQPISNRHKCTAESEIVSVTRKPHGAQPGDRKTRPPLSITPSDGDDMFIEDTYTPKPFTPEKTTERRTSKIHTTTSALQENGHSDGNVNAQKPNMFSFIFKDPLILAGIIGGAVLALLCIVLLIMFTIYRMRKKDEGSYALDEPKKSYGFAYTRARDQEFFA